MTTIKRTVYIVVPVEIEAANEDAYAEALRDAKPRIAFGGIGPHGYYQVTSRDPIAWETKWVDERSKP